MISNVSIKILYLWEVELMETMNAEWFSGSIVFFEYFFSKKTISKKRWSRSSPNNRIRRRPPAKIAIAMTILAQLLRASNLWNLVFKLLSLCLSFNGHTTLCGEIKYSGRLLNVHVQNASAIQAGSFVRHMQRIRKSPAFQTGSSLFFFRPGCCVRQFFRDFLI